MLSGQYALISLLAIAFYFSLVIENGFTPPCLIYAVAAGLIVLSLFMHRLGKHCTANCLLFPTLNILLLTIVSSESRATCGFLFFFPLAISSSAVFNYSQRRLAIFFALFSLALMIISISCVYSLIPYRNYSSETIQAAQLRNVIIAFFLSVVTVYLLISINHHISRQLEDSYLQSKKLNEELDRFVYSTSHDLRAPLLSVLGLLELSENSAEEMETKNYHRLMKLRISNLNKFIVDITNYSRNKRLQITKEDIILGSLANDVWESLRYSPDADGIEFINEIPLDLIVRNDGSRLRIVLSNIIANAIRYHDQHRNRKYIRLYHQQTADSFAIHIEDNGQGIAPEFQAKIFDMFFRGNENSQGTGLGLFIVKETLAKLSSTIQLRSSLQQGSTFIISIPVTEI
jgi:signal transduction histidine kinase